MAVLTSSGIIFGGGDSLNSRYGIIPQSTPMLFLTSSAPIGWTQVTSQNNRCLRVVSSGGGVAGGVRNFSDTLINQPVVGTVFVTFNGFGAGGITLDVNTIPFHAHPANSGGGIGIFEGNTSTGANPGNSTGNYGNSGAHGHSISYSSANASGVSSIDFTTQYVDVIICTLN